MKPEDIPAGRELSREQNWPHRTSDWAYLLERGSGIVAERDGEVVGTIISWRYGENAATVGMVIVSSRCQGEGVGSRLMEAMIERLGNRTLMLNSTEEGVGLYRKYGFSPIDRIYQHQGTAFSVPIPSLQPNERVRPLGVHDHAVVAELDRRASGMDRRNLIASLIERSRGVILDRSNEAVGFALFRRFGRGYSVGPTAAPDIGGAKALISHWLGSKSGTFCRLDVSETSGLSPWLDDLGLPRVGDVTTMVRGTPIERGTDVKLYSLVSQALG
jgi:predicted N-acetyltransferase YhbS